MQVHYYSPEDSFAARTEWQGNCLIWTGQKDRRGYGWINAHGNRVYAHRYAWERVNGPIPADTLIDHQFHCDPACVTIPHLRLATKGQNTSNRAGPSSQNRSSGFRNVYTRGDKHVVQVSKSGKFHYFGTYYNLDEAIAVAARARKELFGKFAGKG